MSKRLVEFPGWYNSDVSDTPEIPIIIGFVTDLYFSSRIESVARDLGYQFIWIEYAVQIAPTDTAASARQYAEHLTGRGAILVEKISAWKPALIIFDLSAIQIPWRQWLPLIKSAPATRRYPVICFGAHVDQEGFRAAREAGVEAVLPRSRFFTDLPQTITKYARRVDKTALSQTCQEPLSEQATHGLESFNRQEYFEAHELLEEAWNADHSPGRELYRAILQIAVAYLQIERGNYNGAIKMFLRVRQWIDPLPDQCRGVNIMKLRLDAQEVYQMLQTLGKERISEFDRALLKPVEFNESP